MTLLVLAFGSLGLILLLHHELWQDEWQAWLIARESAALPDLVRNLRYEGHPGLWHLGLFAVSRISSNPLGMQLLHLGLATCSVTIFLKYAPFNRLQKILFIFGYFPFYEYAALSRHYALGVLGLFGFCALYGGPPPRKYLALAAILFLLCQTSVYGLIIALVLGVILVGTAVQDQDASAGKSIATLGLVLLGIGLAVLQLSPPADSGYAVGWRFELNPQHVMETLTAVWKSYVPIPGVTYHFWGTNLLPDPRGQALLSVMLLGFGVLLLIRQPVPLFLYAVGSAGLLAFSYVKYPGSLRHHGHLFLLLLASLWLSAACPPPRRRASRLPALSDFCQANRDRVLTALFIAHLVAGLAAASLDLLFPFSASQEAARFIAQHHREQVVILGHADDAASSVAGCLGRRLYYPASRRWGSFVIWDQKRTPALEPEQLLQQAAALSRQHQQDALLLLNYELPAGGLPLRLIKKFTRSLVPAENYYLYRLPRPLP